MSVQEIGELPLEGSERDQSNAWIQIDHEVDIALLGVLASSHTPEYADVRCTVTLGDLEDVASTTSESASKRGVRQPGFHCRIPLEIDDQVMSGCLDQLAKCAHCRFSPIGFIGTDDALRDPRSLGKFGLGQACVDTRLPQK